MMLTNGWKVYGKTYGMERRMDIVFDLLIAFCNLIFLLLDGILEILENTNSRNRAYGHFAMDRSGWDGEKGVRIREKYVELLVSLVEKDLLSCVQQLLDNRIS
ncbi:hypothetical protein FIV31_04445 [Coxiella endosymbiont of Ornithodoros amblus]|uniref:hypothetical protein n=1 Tax=Coxiella endosymbiont of Ornithodoros amblus TaxID=1656166 RepID=UPI00244DC56B|nr:hypothetical protein [Coxiella endosymbiont of Ornithodoros amblus]MBW5802751.1 hypothetical protein [Coxiella endosymbiont of Ornithodoros amblus]